MVLVKKRWNTMKVSSWLVKEEYQNERIGTAFQDLFEKRSREEKVRKMYHTLPSNVLGHIVLALKYGFRIEAYLREHYTTKNDEIVVGKKLIISDIPTLQIPNFSDNISTSYSNVLIRTLSNEDKFEVASFLMREMEKSYDNINEEFIQQLFLLHDHFVEERDVYYNDGRTISIMKTPQKILGSVIQVPKRGRLVKAMFFVKEDLEKKYREELIDRIVEENKAKKKRKIWTEVPILDSKSIECFLDRNFEIEGCILEPYKPNVDMVILSKFL